MFLGCSLIFRFPYTLCVFFVFVCFSSITCDLSVVVPLFPLVSKFCVFEKLNSVSCVLFIPRLTLPECEKTAAIHVCLLSRKFS